MAAQFLQYFQGLFRMEGTEQEEIAVSTIQARVSHYLYLYKIIAKAMANRLREHKLLRILL